MLQLRLKLSCSQAAERSHVGSRNDALSYQQPAARGGLGPLFTASSDVEMLLEDKSAVCSFLSQQIPLHHYV